MNKCSEIKVEICLTSRYIELPPYSVQQSNVDDFPIPRKNIRAQMLNLFALTLNLYLMFLILLK